MRHYVSSTVINSGFLNDFSTLSSQKSSIFSNPQDGKKSEIGEFFSVGINFALINLTLFFLASSKEDTVENPAGKDFSNVYRELKGQRKISLDQAMQYSKVLMCDPVDLLFEKSNKSFLK